jgi:hypothetical protein
MPYNSEASPYFSYGRNILGQRIKYYSSNDDMNKFQVLKKDLISKVSKF